MPKSQKSCKPLQDEFPSLFLSNQNEILKRCMTWTEQKLKGTTFKVQSIAIANPLFIDLIQTLTVWDKQCLEDSEKKDNSMN